MTLQNIVHEISDISLHNGGGKRDMFFFLPASTTSDTPNDSFPIESMAKKGPINSNESRSGPLTLL